MDFGPERIAAVALFVLLLCFGGRLIEHKSVCQSSTNDTGCLTLEEPLFDEIPEGGVAQSEFDETTNLETFAFEIMHKFPNTAGVNTLRNEPGNRESDEARKCPLGYSDFGYGCCEKWDSKCTASGTLPLYDISKIKKDAMCEAEHERCEATVTTVDGRIDTMGDMAMLYGSPSLPTTVQGVNTEVLQGNWTIMATFFLDGPEQLPNGDHYGALFIGTGNCGKDTFYIGVDHNKQITLTWGDGDGKGSRITFDATFEVKEWYHIAITFSAYKIAWRQWAQPTLYINGYLKSQNANPGENQGSGWGPFEGTITELKTGGFTGHIYPNGPYYDLFFHGGVKNVEVYNRALELPEIANRAGSFADSESKRSDYIIFPGPYGHSWIEKPCSSDAECQEFGGRKCLVTNRSLAEGAELPEHALTQLPYSDHPGYSRMNIKRCREDVQYLGGGQPCGKSIDPIAKFEDWWRKNESGGMAETILLNGLTCNTGYECIDKIEADSCQTCKAEVYNEHGQVCASVAAGTAMWYENTNTWTNLQTSCKNGTNYDLTKVIDVSDACGRYESNSMGDGSGTIGSNRSDNWKTILGNAQTADTPKDASKVGLRLHIRGPQCEPKKSDGDRCESDSDCFSNYCNPYVDSLSEHKWKTCSPRPASTGCCKAGWSLVTQGLRELGHAYCCPPNYHAEVKMSTWMADKPEQEIAFVGCYRHIGSKTLSETQKICKEENDLNELMTVSMPSISGKAQAAEFVQHYPNGVWTGTLNLGFGGKQKYVEESTRSYSCSDYVKDPVFGPLLTASGVPVAMHCQQLGCGYKDCLIVKSTCDSGTGLAKDQTYMCGSPENVADMGVAFLIFTLVTILLIVGLCFLPCFASQSTSKVQPA